MIFVVVFIADRGQKTVLILNTNKLAYLLFCLLSSVLCKVGEITMKNNPKIDRTLILISP